MNTQKLIIYGGCIVLICLALYRYYTSSTIEGMSSNEKESLEKKFKATNENFKQILGFIDSRAGPEIEYTESSPAFQECVENFRTVNEAYQKFCIGKAFQERWNSPGWKKQLEQAKNAKANLDLISEYY